MIKTLSIANIRIEIINKRSSLFTIELLKYINILNDKDDFHSFLCDVDNLEQYALNCLFLMRHIAACP